MSASRDASRRRYKLKDELRYWVTLDLIRRRGLRIEEFGTGWRVCGSGVDVLASDLRVLEPPDLEPARY